jgi:hypothetical protein
MVSNVIGGIHVVYSTIQEIRQIKIIQDITGIVNVVLGFRGAYYLFQTCFSFHKKTPFKNEKYKNYSKWKRQTLKTIEFVGYLSTIACGLVSKPAIYVFKTSFQAFFSQARVERIFGPKAILGGSRLFYIQTLIFLIGFPSTIKTFCEYCFWLKKKIQAINTLPQEDLIINFTKKPSNSTIASYFKSRFS